MNSTNSSQTNDEGTPLAVQAFFAIYRTVLYAISLPIYVVVLVTFVKSKFYTKSSFYAICISVGVADCLMMLARTAIFIVPSYALLWNGQLPSFINGSMVNE
jgi:hypothetical protein